MRATLALGAMLALAACGGGDGANESPLNDQELSRVIENVAEARPEEKAGPPAPGLSPVRREDLRGGAGAAGCDFSEEGRLLFAASAGDALANVNGAAIHFAASGSMGPSGGFFVTPRFSISIGRLSDAGVAAGASTSWPASLVLTDRGREEGGEVRLEGSWRCGA